MLLYLNEGAGNFLGISTIRILFNKKLNSSEGLGLIADRLLFAFESLRLAYVVILEMFDKNFN